MGRRIESKTSRTAEFTCMARTISYLEKRELYQSSDYISLVIVNSLVKVLVKIPFIRNLIIRTFARGMYEYVIARTKYIDGVMERALREGAEQVLIFGAGFDTRGIRFGGISPGARIFELDAPVTQTAKVNRYRQKGIQIPENLVFIGVDFDRESVPERLLKSGFQQGRKTLFILEGLTMYLQPASVEGTFKMIARFAGVGSLVVFDHIYASVLRCENLYAGERELLKSVTKAGESFCFGLEQGGAGDFLARFGFSASAVLDASIIFKER